MHINKHTDRSSPYHHVIMPDILYAKSSQTCLRFARAHLIKPLDRRGASTAIAAHRASIRLSLSEHTTITALASTFPLPRAREGKQAQLTADDNTRCTRTYALRPPLPPPTHARTFACTHTHPECLGRAQITHRRTLRDSVVRFPWGGAGAALRPGAHWRCDAHRLKRTLTRVTRVARSQVVCASLASVSPSLEQYFLRARCERFANPSMCK